MHQEISRKDAVYIAAAAAEAQKSPVLMRHGAVAVANGRIIAKGHNDYRTSSSTGLMDGYTCHAECSVLHKLMKLKKSPQSSTSNQKMKKLTMYITRLGEGDKLRESAPCHDCCEKMLFFGIKTVVFTEDKNYYLNKKNVNQHNHEIQIVKHNVEDFNSPLITAGQRYAQKQQAHLNDMID